MNQMIGGYGHGQTLASAGGSPGFADQMAKRDLYSYEVASAAWTAQRERRDAAQRAYDSAMEELASAIKAEQEAWLMLEREAGRGAVACEPTPAPYMPRGR